MYNPHLNLHFSLKMYSIISTETHFYKSFKFDKCAVKVAQDLCGRITLCFIKVSHLNFLYKYWRSQKAFFSFINKSL